jgi:hypothetical protein
MDKLKMMSKDITQENILIKTLWRPVGWSR